MKSLGLIVKEIIFMLFEKKWLLGINVIFALSCMYGLYGIYVYIIYIRIYIYGLASKNMKEQMPFES